MARFKGAPHMRMIAIDLPYVMLYNLDVWAFIILASVAVDFLLVKIVKITYNLFTSDKRIKSKNE